MTQQPLRGAAALDFRFEGGKQQGQLLLHPERHLAVGAGGRRAAQIVRLPEVLPFDKGNSMAQPVTRCSFPPVDACVMLAFQATRDVST